MRIQVNLETINCTQGNYSWWKAIPYLNNSVSKAISYFPISFLYLCFQINKLLPNIFLESEFILLETISSRYACFFQVKTYLIFSPLVISFIHLKDFYHVTIFSLLRFRASFQCWCPSSPDTYMTRYHEPGKIRY